MAQIMTFSRKKEPQLQPTQVRTIVQECMHMLQTSLPANIEMKLKVMTPSSLVLADPTQLHQVVMNIANNALQAMQDQGGQMEITLLAIDLKQDEELAADLRPGRYVQISIQDSGPGIIPELQERILEPFFTTRKHKGGTGLGLATSHGIIKRHKGALLVSSQLGQGAKFDIFLPCAHALRELDPSKTTAFIPGGTEKILLVDDDNGLLYAGQKFLLKLGYRVQICSTASQALVKLRRENDFAMVLTDQSMPDIKGLELAEKIRDIYPGLPIILYSGLADKNNPRVNRALQKGIICRFLAKPFSGEELAGCVRQVLDEFKE